MFMKTTLAAVGLTATLLMGSASAETMKVIFASANTPAHTLNKIFDDYFIPTVDKRLAESGDFEIAWTTAFGGTLAGFNDTFEAVEEGIVQMATTITVFEQSNLPLDTISFQVPFGTDDIGLMNKVHRGLHEKFPEMGEAWTSRNQVYLGGAASDSWHLVTQFPVTKYEDIQGKRIGASGAASAWVRAVGAVPVTSQMGESFTNLKNGLFEGYPMSINLAFIYKAFQAAEYITKVNFGAPMAIGISFNKQAWDKMPAHAQDIIREEINIVLDKYSAASVATEARFSEMMTKAGVTISEFSEEERRRWAMAMPNIPQDWAENLEAKGLPAKAVLAAYLDGLREGGAKLARDWDKE